jgi:bifunctional aspartokinase / homoserine dehydrogenase 1
MVGLVEEVPSSIHNIEYCEGRIVYISYVKYKFNSAMYGIYSCFIVCAFETVTYSEISYCVQSGIPCSWMDTREVLVVNPTGSNQVDPDYLESEKRLEKWFACCPAETIIATGFIASTPENIPTTLKRDGSDFSAAIIGSLVKARQVTIWTDVDGVFSADPRKGNPIVIHLFIL